MHEQLGTENVRASVRSGQASRPAKQAARRPPWRLRDLLRVLRVFVFSWL